MSDFTEELMSAISESEFEIDCPSCGEEFTVCVSDIGSSVKCPHCGETIELESD